ncbi:hypothetical protein [Microcoleus sp. herbarium12]|uniref:hypothetical protein n=1 Tax=Microcoleus sp. herbarium12 TaxID=3055437 RepID=UPI002FD51DA4
MIAPKQEHPEIAFLLKATTIFAPAFASSRNLYLFTKSKQLTGKAPIVVVRTEAKNTLKLSLLAQSGFSSHPGAIARPQAVIN